MKKKSTLILAVLMAASLAACGAKNESANTASTADSSAAETSTAESASDDAQESEDEPEEKTDASENSGALIMYQFDKDNMDVDYLDDFASETLENIKRLGDIKKITEGSMTFYEMESDDCTYYYISKEDYLNRLTEVNVTLDNFDEYFELVEDEVWEDGKVEFRKCFRLKDDYLFAMVDYDRLYDNTAEATCRPIEYESSIDTANKTYDWGGYDVRHDEIEVGIDFEETEDYVYKNVIVSTYPENYIEDNGDGTASGVAHEDVTLTNVSIKFYYLNTK